LHEFAARRASGSHRGCDEGISDFLDGGLTLFQKLRLRMGIPAKLNAHSEGKPNDIPG
jgi:hypothetical protein